MKITAEALRGKKIGFFGLGKSNLALIRTLPLEGCEIILRSDRKIRKNDLTAALCRCRIYDDDKALCDISEDILFLSPSVRRDRQELRDAVTKGVVLSSDAELFFENNTKPVYSVTGSDGKSTTATLTKLLLGDGAALIGNIGEPMYPALLGDAKSFVCELSSFMLSNYAPKTRRASVTNITPNHLDYHGSFENYIETKLSLLREADEPILSYDDDILRNYAKGSDLFGVTSTHKCFDELSKECSAQIYLTYEDDAIFLNGESLLERKDIRMGAPHNIKNLMTAIAMTYGLTDAEKIRETAKCFEGLAHRCKHIGCFEGVDCYDSSIDSTPARTVSTLTALAERCVIILGGRGKGVSYSPLREPLSKYCHTAVIYGDDAPLIREAIDGVCPILLAEDFDSAVMLACRCGKAPGRVLLSPAATSYDSFKNYEERGKRFKEIVEKTYKSN